jgi:hypothetical protein
LKNLKGNDFDFVDVGTNGIYNNGIELGAKKDDGSIIDDVTIVSMENVRVYSYGQAITSYGKIGTMTNCVFSGDGMGLNIQKLHNEMLFVDCEIHSKNIAIYIAEANDSTEEAPVAFNLGNTKIVTDGAVYALTDHIKNKTMFNGLTSAVALVNGRLYTSLADAVNALKASKEEVTTFALIGDLANAEEGTVLGDLIYGLLDLCALLLLFLPLFADRVPGAVVPSSLLMLGWDRAYLKVIYIGITAAIVLFGIAELALQNFQNAFWVKNKKIISLSLGVAAVLLFTVSLQPYAAVLAFSLTAIKTYLLIKLR